MVSIFDVLKVMIVWSLTFGATYLAWALLGTIGVFVFYILFAGLTSAAGLTALEMACKHLCSKKKPGVRP